MLGPMHVVVESEIKTRPLIVQMYAGGQARLDDKCMSFLLNKCFCCYCRVPVGDFRKLLVVSHPNFNRKVVHLPKWHK